MSQPPDRHRIILEDLDAELHAHMKQDMNGIWLSESESTQLSYPDKGHHACFTVEGHSLWFQHRNKCISLAVTAFPPNGLLFDIGGGNGFVSAHLQTNGVTCCLVEPGTVGAYNARINRDLTHVICGTASELGFLQGRLPSIGIFDVLEHIEDSTDFLCELYGLLSPGGRLYITVPAHKWLWSASDIRAMHFRRYTQKSLQQSLRKSGFEVEYCTGIFGALTPGIFLFRSLLSLWGLRGPKKANPNQTQEHGTSGGLGWKIMKSLLNRDLKKIRLKKSVFGPSLLCVAKKPEGTTA